MKNLDEAEDLYKKSMKQDSENPLVRMNYAIHLIRTKRISSAKEILEKLLKENSSLFYAEMCLGYAHYLKQEYNTAGIHINRGIKINPDFYDLYYHRALVYYKKGNYFAATQDLNKAEKLNPGLKKISDLRILIKKSSGM
jgi:tetratricopeptide (TPR) repeat protein